MVALMQGEPESVGLSSRRLKVLSDVLAAEINRGTIPGAVIAVGRHGKLVHFDALGRQDPATTKCMGFDSIFRIWSMTKPIVSIAMMQLVEDGKILLGDPVSKYFPSFANGRVAVHREGRLQLLPAARSMTIHDLLRHTSGLISPTLETGPLREIYNKEGISTRNISNRENAELLAHMPLFCHPGEEWKYSRSTDLLGSIIEVVSDRSLGQFLSERIFTPLGMQDTGFYIDKDRAAGRIAEAFANDPWTGEDVSQWSFDVTTPPTLEAGGSGLVSTAMDYARFAQMLLSGGATDGQRIIGKSTIRLMTADHLADGVKVTSDLIPPGHGFGLGFCVRRVIGMADYPGGVGQYFWFGAAGTQFWCDPAENLWAILMVQAPNQRDFLRVLIRNLVYAAIEP